MKNYRTVAVETYLNKGEASSAQIRARPLPGQGFPIDMKVEFSRKMRELHPVGTVFAIQATVVNKGVSSFLYSSYQWPCRVIARSEAEKLIASGKLS
jgi:hypothetical protein